MNNQKEKCTALAALHNAKDAWVIPNPWDAGSAQDLEKLGFKALATSSSACAYTLGKSDGSVTLDEKLAHCQSIVSNTNLPVSVDFEDGYSNDPKEVAANILKLVTSGVAGCSVEDFSRVDQKIFDFNHAVERCRFSWWLAPMGLSEGTPIWTTLLSGCRHSPKRVRICFMRRA